MRLRILLAFDFLLSTCAKRYVFNYTQKSR